MNRGLESLIKKSDKIKDPVIKGTLRIASRYIDRSLKNDEEDHHAVFSFLNDFRIFYEEESQMHSGNYDARNRFNDIDTSGKIKDLFTKGMVKAMANSAIDSLGGSEEDGNAVQMFLNKAARFYWREAKKSSDIGLKKYKDLSGSQKLYLYNKFLNSGLSREEFASRNELSSTYALDKIRKEYEVRDNEYASISEIIGSKTIAMASG